MPNLSDPRVRAILAQSGDGRRALAAHERALTATTPRARRFHMRAAQRIAQPVMAAFASGAPSEPRTAMQRERDYLRAMEKRVR